MLRILLTIAVLAAALLGLQSTAEANGTCCGHDAGVTASEPQASHEHHQDHDAPHAPHNEPDGCPHQCASCLVTTPTQAALAAPVALPAPVPARMQVLTADRAPGGPPPAAPFQVPRY